MQLLFPINASVFNSDTLMPALFFISSASPSRCLFARAVLRFVVVHADLQSPAPSEAFSNCFVLSGSPLIPYALWRSCCYSRSSAHFGHLIFAECLRLTPSFWSSIGRWACRPNHGLTKTPERLCHSSFLNRQERSADSPSPESNRPNQSRDTKSVAIIREI